MNEGLFEFTAFCLGAIYLVGIFSKMSQATQWGRVEIKNLKVSGQCSDGQVTIVPDTSQDALQDVLKAKFESLAANAKAGGHQKQSCSLYYDLVIPLGRTLKALTFTVDNRYSLSENGEVRITVKHRVGNSKSFDATQFRSTEEQDPAKGSIDGISAVLSAKSLSKCHRQDGATIPVTTTIIVSAVNGKKGQSTINAVEGATKVTLNPLS